MVRTVSEENCKLGGARLSLKPKKKSEQEKIIQKTKAKERKMDIMNVLPPYTMIVSEGTKTEPYYLNGFVSKINDKYKKITNEKRIEICGTGRNTQGLEVYLVD